MIGTLSSRRTPYHALPAGLKLVMLCGYCTAVTLANTPALPLAALAAVLILAGLAGGWFLRTVLTDLKWPAIIAALITAWHGWNGAIASGLTLGATLLACIAAATMLSRTTSPSELLDTIDSALGHVRVPQTPRRRLALAVALTLRFVPALNQRAKLLVDAHKARSPRRVGWRVLPPLALGALDEADRTADALRARSHTQ